MSGMGQAEGNGIERVVLISLFFKYNGYYALFLSMTIEVYPNSYFQASVVAVAAVVVVFVVYFT